MLRLRDALQIPYALHSESLITEDGEWTRRVSYPELGCSVCGVNMVQNIEELEMERVRTIVGLAETRIAIPTPRDPLHEDDPATMLAQAGLEKWIECLDEYYQ